MLSEVGNLTLVHGEHVLQTQRQVLDIPEGLVADHQNRLGTVIGSHHDKGRAGVVNVKCGS